MQRNINYSETFGLSVALSSIAISSPFAKMKILHDNELNPFVYAIGFGCENNSSIIVGGSDEDDEISSYIIIKLAQDISKAYHTGQSIMGIDIAKALLNKGIWFIPNYKACNDANTTKNLIANRISPKRMLEISSSESDLKYNIGKKSDSNASLLAFILSSSNALGIEKCGNLPQNSLSNWFSKEFSKPSFSMGLSKLDEELMLDDADIISKRLIELFLLYIIA